MAKVLVYYAHPGARYSRVNTKMAQAARSVAEITFIDLYARYPRQTIDVDAEQKLLLDHDVILFQFPLFWYSTPSIIKEWQDLVLETGFAYGKGGNRLAGKVFMLAITASGSSDAYTKAGHQNFPLRTFLTPLEQTARLCQMRFVPPYVLHSALQVDSTGVADHVAGYTRLLAALKDDRLDFDAVDAAGDILTFESPLIVGEH